MPEQASGECINKYIPQFLKGCICFCAVLLDTRFWHPSPYITGCGQRLCYTLHEPVNFSNSPRAPMKVLYGVSRKIVQNIRIK